MKKKLLLLLMVVSALASCSTDDDMQKAGDGSAVSATLTCEPYIYDGETRSALTETETGLKFSWKNGESIGVFPVWPTSNCQAKKTIYAEKEGLTAKFDGEGWELKRGNYYAAYSPYNGSLPSDTRYDAVPMDMTGQVQNGNASLAHIGDKYDYMTARAIVPDEGTVNFCFRHLNAVIILDLTAPVAANWEKVTLTSRSKVFHNKASYNVFYGCINTDEQLYKTDITDMVSLGLTNVSTTSANEKLTLYLASLDADTGPVTLIATTSEGVKYTAVLDSKDISMGYVYKWSAVLRPLFTKSGTEEGHDYVDLDLPSGTKWACVNVGATSPTDYGQYYAWGEVKGYGEEDLTNWRNHLYAKSYVKTYYDWVTYKYATGLTNVSKYCIDSNYGKVDGLTTLEPEDDAATVNWGDNWRMPTYDEIVELHDNCYWQYTKNYNESGVAGYIIFKAKSESDKGISRCYTSNSTPLSGYSLADTHIFLPLGGTQDYHGFYTKTSLYFSSSLDLEYNDSASGIYLENSEVCCISRSVGCTIRAVHK